MAERRHALSGQLTSLRRSLGLSQAEVALRMGTSQSAVARFEAGDLDVRLSTIERYTAALGGNWNGGSNVHENDCRRSWASGSSSSGGTTERPAGRDHGHRVSPS